MKKLPSEQKMRGGYYTPPNISDFVVSWGLGSNATSILEPSCGDGSFLEAVKRRSVALGIDDRLRVDAVEIDSGEAAKARAKSGYDVINDDFFLFSSSVDRQKRYDLVVGNPPFIRYQCFDADCRDRAFSQMRALGFNPTKLTNIWVPFLVIASHMLKSNGKVGMVIPAELLQVNYAAECRQFLANYFGRITIASFKSLLFEGTQQEVLLVLAERVAGFDCANIRFIEFDNAASLDLLTLADTDGHPFAPMDEKLKWTRYYLTDAQRKVLSDVAGRESILPTTCFFDTNVGLVSGNNDFFLLSQSDVHANGLENSVVKLVSRTEQVKGIVFDDDDFAAGVAGGRKMFMLDVRDEDANSLSEEQAAYIARGEKQGADLSYKCRIRKNWFTVPISWQPTGFAIRQAGRFPRIVVNETSATSTDTVHKVRFHDDVNPYQVAASFINSFTFAQSETVGRGYGGGVLTFEPSEIRLLRLPTIGADRLDCRYVDKLVRANKIEKALDYTDRILLRDGLGLSDDQIRELRNAWLSLSNRRLSRKRRRPFRA